MQKILFNDKYDLTHMVLQRHKTQTRRLIKCDDIIARHFNKDLFENRIDPCAFYRDERGMCRLLKREDFEVIMPKYSVGEVVAISQSYRDLGYSQDWVVKHIKPNPKYSGREFGKIYPGWDNKMFVAAEYMQNFIKMTKVWAEFLKDISDEDCINEGIIPDFSLGSMSCHYFIPRCPNNPYATPKEAYAALIDKLGKKGTWENSLMTFAYEFTLTDKNGEEI